MHALSLRNWCKSSRCCPSSLSLIMTRRHAHTVERTNQTPRNPYPYPAHRNPTPHQIFHLPHSASDADIKARCMFFLFRRFMESPVHQIVWIDYDLVRLYHPDKAAALLSTQISADEAHARFRAITAAYDALRRKTALNGLQPSAATTSMPNQYQTTAAYRAMQRKRQELYDGGAVDDSRTDRLLIAGIVAVCTHFAFCANIYKLIADHTLRRRS